MMRLGNDLSTIWFGLATIWWKGPWNRHLAEAFHGVFWSDAAIYFFVRQDILIGETMALKVSGCIWAKRAKDLSAYPEYVQAEALHICWLLPPRQWAHWAHDLISVRGNPCSDVHLTSEEEKRDLSRPWESGGLGGTLISRCMQPPRTRSSLPEHEGTSEQ